MILYMAVTADKYELPICVADSAGELAACVGRRREYVLKLITIHKQKPPKKGMKMIKIICEDDEDDEDDHDG